MNLALTSFDPGEEVEIPIEIKERIERDEKIILWFERVFHILNAYQSHQQNDAKALRMSLKTMQFALGFTLAAGTNSQAQLARNLGVSKQRVKKCLAHFMEQLRLEPLPFQRSELARENMTKARKEQLA